MDQMTTTTPALPEDDFLFEYTEPAWQTVACALRDPYGRTGFVDDLQFDEEGTDH